MLTQTKKIGGGVMDQAFQYFVVAGAGVGLGLSISVFPCWLLVKKIQNGGFKRGKKGIRS